jgi:phytoene dehydrogenase-like protein|tara:strand:- start:212 stop:1144 length:933 start_codon:yes stop_codon:yes gene_type:complete
MGEVDGSVGSWGYARGGMGSITQAMMGCLKDHGGEVKPSSEVTNVITKNGKAIGVATQNGDEYYAKKIVSNLDVKRTFLKITEEKDLPDDFVRSVKNFKIRGSSGKLNIALDALPDFPCIPEGDPGGGGDMHFTETIEEMEGAYDDWKRGEWSRNPYVDMCIPSKSDPTMAEPGKHYMSVFIQYVPFNLANGGWNEERKQEFGRHIVDCISEFSPNFKDLINHYEVRTPLELENEVGLTEGNIFQGELTMDQLMFNRPVPGYAQYRTPLKNMYICSSSTHPGGGVMGAPGANAAREVLLDMNVPQKGNYY